MADPYSGVAISGYNANPPDDDGSQTEANKVKWATIKTKITDPLKTRTDSMDTEIADAFSKVVGGAGVTSYSTSTTIPETDQSKLVRATVAGITLTTPDATAVASPFVFAVLNDTSGDIILDGNGSQTVDGDASVTIPTGCGLFVFTNGTNWFTTGQNFPTTVIYPPAGLFTNLIIKVTGNTGLTVAADAITVSNGTTALTLASVSHTINMATTGANALDTGSIAAATWYAIWEIAKADGTKAALASTSFSSPTMPTDYIHKARIGAVRTAAGAAQLMGTWQFGRRVQYKVGLAQTANIPIAASGTAGNTSSPTWSAVSVSSYVPTTASEIQGTISQTGNATVTMAAPNNSYGAYNSTTNPPPAVINVAQPAGSGTPVNQPFDFLLESTSIYWASGGASNFIAVTGWVDNI